jgi:hypothetical protein
LLKGLIFFVMRFITTVAALSAAVVLTSAPFVARADDADAQTLLAKHRAYVGWQLGDGTFKTLKLTREYEDAHGKTTAGAVETRAGLIYRNTYTDPDRPGLSRSSGFTGNVFWTSGYNGFTTPIYGDVAKYRGTQDALLNEGFASLPGTLQGSKQVAGQKADVVRVTVPNGDTMDLAIIPETGAIVQAVIDAGASDEATIEVLSYTEPLPGKKIIGSFRYASDDGTYRYAKVEPNVVVTDANLHPPATRANWTFGDPKPFPITLTSARILVDATVNGVKGRFILDTGSSSIVLNNNFASRVGAKPLHLPGEAQTLAMGGRSKIDTQQVDTIQFGSSTLSNVVVDSRDFNAGDYQGLDDKNYDGLIGFDLFAGAVVRIHADPASMSITDPATTNLSGETGLPVLADISDGIPVVPMQLDGSINVNATLDSGDPADVLFGPDLIYKYHLRMASRAAAAIPGFGNVECGVIDQLTLGPIVYRSVDACKRTEDIFTGRNIIVGLDFLRHFNLTFDYPNGRLYFEPLRQ